MKLPYWIGWVLLALVGCSAPPPAPEPTAAAQASATPTPRPRPDLVTEAGRAIFRNRLGRPWLMEALRSRYNDGKRQASLDKVDWTLTDDKGKKLVRIVAPKAFYKMEAQHVEFEGEVRAERYHPTHEVVLAGHMTWDGKTGVLEGTRGVSWSRGKTRVQGDRAITNDKLERIHVEGHVKVTTLLEGDPLDTGG